MGSQQLHTTLGPLDHIPPRNYVKFSLYLPLNPGVDTTKVFDQLHEGLHRLFFQFPWLGGKVYWQSPDTAGWRPGQLEIRYSPPDEAQSRPYQFKYNIIEDAPEYEELAELGFPTNTFRDAELLWAPFMPSVDDGAEVFVGQANFIPGGCVLCAAIFHSVSDGTATATFFKVWADSCKAALSMTRDESANALMLPPGSDDRSLLDNLWRKEGSGRLVKEIDPSTWRILGLDTPSLISNAPAVETNGKGLEGNIVLPERKMNSRIFYISPEKFTLLKTECLRSAKVTGDSTSNISGNDALSALIWQGLMRARLKARGYSNGHKQDPLSCLEMTLDGRPDFSQALPSTYLGNVILINQSFFPLAELTSPQTEISEVARVIRENGSRIYPESVLDSYTLVKNIPDYNQLKLRFTTVEGNDMMITSLLKFESDSLSFGDEFFDNDGKPTAFRPLMEGFELFFRISFILPMKSHGGIEFVVSLYDNEMDELLGDQEFGKYAMLLC
ncbi:hypothetical protein F4777DRAFT_32147 [Nemania sp. FL0916]|nr:hypothetical protein F4777DRAFT_32147 [Nemania sp. FL0916]